MLKNRTNSLLVIYWGDIYAEDAMSKNEEDPKIPGGRVISNDDPYNQEM